MYSVSHSLLNPAGWRTAATAGYLGDLSGQKSIFGKSAEVEHKVT